MNEFEVRELFIIAAEIDGRLPDAERPARLKSQSLPFVHSFEDRRGWEPADMSGGLPLTRKNRFGAEITLTELERIQLKLALKDKLEYGDRGRRGIEAEDFWDGDRITPRQVTEWEKANELIALVSRARNRRCLWAWVQSKTKTLRVPDNVLTITNVQPNHLKKIVPIFSRDAILKPVSFSSWCRHVEGIHRNYGKTCADHAIAEITLKLVSKAFQPNEKRQNGTLQNGAEIRDIRDRLDDSAAITYRNFDPMGGWAVKDEKRALMRFDESLMHLDMRDEQTRRRERERKRKQQEAA